MHLTRNQLLGLVSAVLFFAATVVVGVADDFGTDTLRWVYGLQAAGLTCLALAHFLPPRIQR